MRVFKSIMVYVILSVITLGSSYLAINQYKKRLIVENEVKALEKTLDDKEKTIKLLIRENKRLQIITDRISRRERRGKQ